MAGQTPSGRNAFVPQYYYSVAMSGLYGATNEANWGQWLYFNASHYNPIYSDSCNTVQSNSYTVMYIMKIKA